MTTEEAVEQLLRHAGLLNDSDEFIGIAGALYHAGHDNRPIETATLIRDVLTCFQSLNLFLNGKAPETSSSLDQRPDVDRRAAYAVSMITCDLISARLGPKLLPAEMHHDIELLTKAITFAWEAVLAGDITDIETDAALNAHLFSVHEGKVVPDWATSRKLEGV